MSPRFFVALTICLAICAPRNALAWGDEGHEIVGLIADHYLEPSVRQKVIAILARDTTGLTTGTDIASEATWADKYRDENNRKDHYQQTENWHFVDLELSSPNLKSACFGQPHVPAGTPASGGPAEDCVVDKINQFTAELAAPGTSADERLMALQFVLHFIGDLHQPLHASDNHDRGGNEVKVSAAGLPANNLHHYWDTEFVAKLGQNPQQIAQKLIAKITSGQAAKWQSGTTADWAQESFQQAKDIAYGHPVKTKDGSPYQLDSAYVKDATQVVALQLSKAGVRLAAVLNQALSANHSGG